MRKYNRILALCLCLILLIGVFAACQPAARKYTPNTVNQGYNTTNRNNVGMRTPTLPNKYAIPIPNRANTPIGTTPYGTPAPLGMPGTTTSPSSMGANREAKISATFEMVDFTYATMLTTTSIRSGLSAAAPILATAAGGQSLRVLGKVDGWYVVRVPNTYKVGCIPTTSARPSVASAGSTANPVPIPKTGTTTNTGSAAATGSATMTTGEARILELCNAERTKAGLKPLAGSGELTKLARMKSQDMVNLNYFSHQSPTYGSPFDMMKTYGVRYMTAGENIAKDFSADAAFKAWMNSEGHRRNIMNPNFTEIGIGIAGMKNGMFIYTQQFIGR